MISSDVGIVVIGRNEGERLRRCLLSVHPEGQCVVYVDSGSTDGSPQVAELAGAYVVQLDMRRAFTAARARNEGFKRLKQLHPACKFVQFIDGDCQLVPTWLLTAQAFLSEQADAAVVCGRREEEFPEASVYNRICDVEWNAAIGEAEACGGDAMFKVAAFEAADGFNPDIQAVEEPELCHRLRAQGWRVWRIDAKMTTHDACIARFRQWWLRAVRSGLGYAKVVSVHRTSREAPYRTELMRTILWGGVIPMAIITSALFYPAALAGLLVYPLTIARIAFRRGPREAFSWQYATLITIAKFAELQGVLIFYRGGVRRIEYKVPG